MLKTYIQRIKPYWLEVIFTVLIISMMINGIVWPMEYKNASTSTFLVPNDTLFLSTLDRAACLQFLLKSVQDQQAFSVQNDIALNNRRMEGFLFFITIFAGVLTAVLLMGKPVSSDDRTKKGNPNTSDYRAEVALYALILGFIWYGFNILRIDVESRQLPVIDMLNRTAEQLLSMPSKDSLHYELKYAKAESIRVSFADPYTRKFRKIHRFVTPSSDDMQYNLMPLLVLVSLRYIVKRSRLRVSKEK